MTEEIRNHLLFLESNPDLLPGPRKGPVRQIPRHDSVHLSLHSWVSTLHPYVCLCGVEEHTKKISIRDVKQYVKDFYADDKNEEE